jgi:hypothetical protein
MKYQFKILTILAFIYSAFIDAGFFNCDSRYSMLKIAPGATFSVDQPIASFDGSLVRQTGGTLTGAGAISFLDAIFEDAGNFNF